MSAYGDMLGCFPELFDNYKLVSATPVVGGGYITKDAGTVLLIVQTAGKTLNVQDSYSRAAGSSGTAAGIVTQLSAFVAFSYEPLDLFNNFVEIEGHYYRCMSGEDWAKEGDFYRYELHRIIGAIQQTTTHMIIGGDF